MNKELKKSYVSAPKCIFYHDLIIHSFGLKNNVCKVWRYLAYCFFIGFNNGNGKN